MTEVWRVAVMVSGYVVMFLDIVFCVWWLAAKLFLYYNKVYYDFKRNNKPGRRDGGRGDR